MSIFFNRLKRTDMNITDLITDRMHENLNPRDISTFESFRWLIEKIATEYAESKVKKLLTTCVSVSVCPKCGCNKITGDGSKSWCLNSECDFIESD
jgi:hypothetical protein